MFSNKVLRPFLLGAVAAVLVSMPPAILAADLTHSPVIGGVTTSKAKVQFRTDMATSSGVVIQYATTEAGLATPSSTAPVATAAGSDFTATVEIGGLAEDQTYFYKILVDGVDSGSVYKFNTLPPANAGATCTLAVFADVSNDDLPAPAYASGRSRNPTMALQIGDFNHGAPFNPKRGTTPARSMHKLMRDPSTLHGADFLNNIASQMSLMHIFDDHDYCGNDSDGSCRRKSEILAAFKEYYPSYDFLGDTTGNGEVAQKFGCGDAEIFVLDTRTQRPPEAASASEAAAAGRSMLGADQLAWLKLGLSTSTATWKIIISTVTASKDARDGLAYDNWAGFEEENQIMFDFLHDADAPITNVIMVSADIHTGGGIDDGRNNRWGIPEMSISHTNLDAAGTAVNNGRTGTWSEGVASGNDGGGYGLITVTGETLDLKSIGASMVDVIRNDFTLHDGKQTSFTQGPQAEMHDLIPKFEAQFGSNSTVDTAMRAKFVRLGFHDCVGGCDGCIDSGADNNGLDIPIYALQHIVDEANELSRADVWAAAAFWAAGASQDPDRPNSHIEFSIDMIGYGRTDCENAPGESHQLDPQASGYNAGPVRHLPSADLDSHGLKDFFLQEFGYDTRETVAIMGAHTLGKLHPENSGFNSGEIGWVLNDHILDNNYYQVLVGPEAGSTQAAGMTEEERLFDAVDWDVQPALDNNGIPTGKFQWDHTFPDRTDVAIMTNADIALAREFSGDAYNKADLNNPSTGEGDFKDSLTGEVSCIFKCRRNNNCPRDPVCPGAWATLNIMDEYQSDLNLWLTEFREVFARMLRNKYQFDSTCEIEPCNLIGLPGGASCSESHQCLSGVCLGDGTCKAES